MPCEFGLLEGLERIREEGFAGGVESKEWWKAQALQRAWYLWLLGLSWFQNVWWEGKVR